MWLTSASSIVSADPTKPTIFENERSTILPKGMVSLNLMDWTEVVIPVNVTAVVQTRAAGHLSGTVFVGEFLASMTYVESKLNLTLEGKFELHLA